MVLMLVQLKFGSEGCFPTNVDYSDGDYAVNEQVTVTMQVRYDNATHYEGDNDTFKRKNSSRKPSETVETGSHNRRITFILEVAPGMEF